MPEVIAAYKSGEREVVLKYVFYVYDEEGEERRIILTTSYADIRELEAECEAKNIQHKWERVS